MGFPVAAAIAGGASVLGGLFGKSASKKASDAQTQSAAQAIAEQRRQYDQTRADFAPWREAGGAAIGDAWAMLQPGYDHTTSPGYEFRRDEALRAVGAHNAANGSFFSGGHEKDILKYADGYAAADFGDNFNRKMAIAAGGQQANSTLGALGSNTANNIGSAYMQAGNARASGYVGQANAMNGMFNNLATIGMYYGGGGGTNAYGINGAGGIY